MISKLLNFWKTLGFSELRVIAPSFGTKSDGIVTGMPEYASGYPNNRNCGGILSGIPVGILTEFPMGFLTRIPVQQ